MIQSKNRLYRLRAAGLNNPSIVLHPAPPAPPDISGGRGGALAKGSECQHLHSDAGSGRWARGAGACEASSPAAFPPLLPARAPFPLRGGAAAPRFASGRREAGLPGKQLTSCAVPWKPSLGLLLKAVNPGQRGESWPAALHPCQLPQPLPGHTAAATGFGLRPVTHSEGAGGWGCWHCPPP